MDTQGKRSVAVFDIDGTLFRSSLLIELVERLIDQDIFPAKARTIYTNAENDWRDRKGDYGKFVRKVVEAFGKNIKGIPYGEVADVAGEIIEAKKDHVYRYTRDLVKDLKKQGYFLLAISHSPKFIVDGFGYELGFDKTYGTFYETGASNRFTGVLEDEELIMNKAAVLTRAVKKENLSLVNSFGVGDTESDIPMLEMVDNPIVFNPNNALYKQAQKRMWKVVVERKDVIYEM
jgi:HAD superfamily hydrolase (TIGR01490 family)